MLKSIKNKNWLLVLILVLVGGFVYSFNLNNGLFWDDDDWIINNIYVQSLNWGNIKFWFTHNTLAGVGLTSNYYRPFLFFTFALNYVVSGIEPLTYHLLSNAIHLFNGVLIFWLIRLAFKRNLLAFLTALFFLIHPLQTEAITYISGRGDALAAMFMLLGLLFFYKSENYMTHEVRRTSWVNKLLAVGSLVFGLLSRETAIIFPVLALAFYVSVLSSSRLISSRFDLLADLSRNSPQAMVRDQGRTFLKSLRRGLLKTWPFFAIVFVYGILRLTVLNFQNTLNFYTEPNVYSESLYVRLLTFLPILWEYVKLLFVPVGLHMERSAVVYVSFFQWPVWAIALVLIGLLWWLRYLYKKNNPEFKNLKIENSLKIENWKLKIWFLGVSWFFIALAPVSGITPINALIYEHWLYLPMVGFWLIISFYLMKLLDYQGSMSQGSTFLKNQGRTLILRALVVIALISYFSFFAYQSIRRNILWGDHVRFYENILKYQPKSLKINNNLGNLYLTNGDMDKAEIYYRKAIETGDVFGQPYYNLGRILQTRGDVSGAIKLYEKAVEVDPSFYYAYQNLAATYAQQGDLGKSAENIEKLKKLLPQNPRVYYNSALVYLALNNKSQALEDLNIGLKYVQLDPETGKLIEELLERLKK